MNSSQQKHPLKLVVAVLFVMLLTFSLQSRHRIPKLKGLRQIRTESKTAPFEQKDVTHTTSAAPLVTISPETMQWKGPGDSAIQNGALRITIDDQAWFDPGTAKMNSKGIQGASSVAEAIKKMSNSWRNYTIQIEGHSDSLPVVRHRQEYPTNWELSGSRAFSVVRVLEAHSFVRERLSGVGYSDTRPQGQTAARRLVVVIYPDGGSQEIARR